MKLVAEGTTKWLRHRRDNTGEPFGRYLEIDQNRETSDVIHEFLKEAPENARVRITVEIIEEGQ